MTTPQMIIPIYPNQQQHQQQLHLNCNYYEEQKYEDPRDVNLFSEMNAAVIPEEATDLDLVDSMIAHEMTSLSMEDRDKVYYDVHGVIAPLVQETPQLIQASLLAMEQEIVLRKNREAYNLALTMNPSYVRDPKFRLAFLRADAFDPKKAALRILRHFQTKLDLFGPSKLAVDITQDDLDQETMDSMESGDSQYLDQTDQSGRFVSLWVANAHHESHSVQSLLRREFYRNMAMVLGDETVQQRGVVGVLYFLGHQSDRNFPYEQSWALPKVTMAIPVRLVAIHVFYDNPWFRPVLAIMKASFHLTTRIRIRAHYGKFERIYIMHIMLLAEFMINLYRFFRLVH